MINGLQLKVTSQELSNHCASRAEYHRKRANEYRTELPKMKDSLEALKKQGLTPPTVSYMNKSGGYDRDPIEDMEDKIREHANKALVFDFFSSHLFPEDYNLNENDLTRLEITKK